MKKVLVILGPTATGKTDLALSLAKKFNGELIACDSRQVYRGLDIGTGKYGGKGQEVSIKGDGCWEIGGIKVWMYDVVDLNTQFSVYDFEKIASQRIENIIEEGRLPILVGGTGLYIKALTQGFSNLSIPFNPGVRDKYQGLGVGELQKKLQSLSLERWNSLNSSDKQNKRRLLRSIELVTMNPYVSNDQVTSNNNQIYDFLKIGLTAPREVLNSKINYRCLDWIQDGIIGEVKKLIKSGIKIERFVDLGLEYKVIVEYLNGQIDKDQMVEKMQTKVRQYAKRQLTWFKKEEDIVWFDITDKTYLKKVEKKINL